jgi:hypothetical protein
LTKFSYFVEFSGILTKKKKKTVASMDFANWVHITEKNKKAFGPRNDRDNRRGKRFASNCLG